MYLRFSEILSTKIKWTGTTCVSYQILLAYIDQKKNYKIEGHVERKGEMIKFYKFV
jgi:hypothetical protein